MTRVSAEWRGHAACRTADPELFFPVSQAGPSVGQIEQAKQLCRACPVREPCLGWALGHGHVSGIWGGTTEDERRALRRTQRPLPARDRQSRHA